MCGIVGIYNLSEKDNEIKLDQVVKKMTDSIAHRGPDDEGFYVENKVALGHRRLAIIDLSPLGHQPMFSEDSNLVIVFNGEIYNYLELAEELEGLGHSFKSKCDTEVILHAYEEWGEKSLNRFLGMWAFVLWDKSKQEMFCSLDRWGVKPFYYVLDKEKFVFGSEIKAIFQYPGVKREPNYANIFDFLVFNRTDHNQDTCFSGVKRLMPGHWLKINRDGKVICKKWYTIKYQTYKFNHKDDDLIANSKHLRLLLEKSVELRLRSDAPVGSCLSGGLDSSTIVALVKNKYVNTNLKTFSAVFPGSWADESRYIKLVNKKFSLKNYQVEPTSKDLLKDVKKLIYHQEEPFGSSSIFASWSVMKLAHKHKIKVLLDGQGGDEILAGYPYMAGFYFYEIFKNGHLICAITEMIKFWKKQKFNFLSAFQIFIFKLSPKFLQNKFLRFSSSWIDRDFFNKYEKKSRFAESFFSANSLNESLANHLKHKLAHLLRYEDKNAMAFSIENREVFLDQNLVEFALKSAGSLKIKNGATKMILREAMKDILPEKISNRHDKIGFDTPEEMWFRKEEMLDFVGNIIQSDSFRKRGLFDLTKIIRIFENFKNNSAKYQSVLWKLVCLELWFRIFIDPDKF
ncbi:MAG: asparagine synthase (glutamine-hydrolyzing) [Candidatus Berkelbacteria bacterium]